MALFKKKNPGNSPKRKSFKTAAKTNVKFAVKVVIRYRIVTLSKHFNQSNVGKRFTTTNYAENVCVVIVDFVE